MSDLHRPKKIHRTLVWGGWYGSRNIGDTAILLGIRELYKQINFDRHYYISFLSTDIDYTSTNGVTGKRALLKSDVIKPWNFIKLINIFRETDRVIISGGTPIFDYSHAIRTLYFFLPLVFKKPFILFGAGIKPIKSFYGKKYIPFVLKKANYLSVRDDGSEKILRSLGLEKVVKTADSAFFAPSAEDEILKKLLDKYKIKWSDKLLVVAPRLMSPDKKRLYLDEDMSEKIISETPVKIAEAIDKTASDYDHVVLMAMHYYGPDSDVSLIEKIKEKTKAKNVVFINEELRAETGVALFKHAYIVLAMRLHALLLSSSMYTPVVGIAYEQKVKDLFRRIGQDDSFVDLFDFSKQDLVNKINYVHKNRNQISKEIEYRVSKLRKLVLADAERVLKIDIQYTTKAQD